MGMQVDKHGDKTDKHGDKTRHLCLAPHILGLAGTRPTLYSRPLLSLLLPSTLTTVPLYCRPPPVFLLSVPLGDENLL